MLGLDDKRWGDLKGGYRTRFDPRPLFRKLETETDRTGTWHELWDELHHQGDVGEASYASVPHLVNICRSRSIVDWNTYAIVCVIDLARERGKNPPLPEWLQDGYFRAIQELAELGAIEILRTKDPETVRAILSILAISRGARTHAWFIFNYSAEELLELKTLEKLDL